MIRPLIPNPPRKEDFSSEDEFEDAKAHWQETAGRNIGRMRTPKQDSGSKGLETSGGDMMTDRNLEGDELPPMKPWPAGKVWPFKSDEPGSESVQSLIDRYIVRLKGHDWNTPFPPDLDEMRLSLDPTGAIADRFDNRSSLH